MPPVVPTVIHCSTIPRQVSANLRAIVCSLNHIPHCITYTLWGIIEVGFYANSRRLL